MRHTERLYAWIAQDVTGVEGIIAIPGPNGGIFPLVVTQLELALTLQDKVLAAVEARQADARLVTFVRGHTVMHLPYTPT